jgi:predicted exporter
MANQNEFYWVLISAELPGSPFTASVQDVTISAVEKAAMALKKQYKDSRILRAGTVFHSAAARKRAEKDIDIIGGVSLIGIILLLLSAYHSLKVLSLGLLSIGVGIVAGLLTAIMVFGRVHLMTLIFGASLLGEAIDYSIQYFSARLGAGESWNSSKGLKLVQPRLVVALLTSILGYTALTLTPFPVLSQIGVFAISGLIASLLTVFIIFPPLLTDVQRKGSKRLLQVSGALITGYRNRLKRGHVLFIIGGVIICSAFGIFRLTSEDDVKLLIASSPELVKDELLMRELTGTSGSSQFILIEGSSVQEVLEREENLNNKLQTNGIDVQAVSSFIPSCKQQYNNRAIYRKSMIKMKDAMEVVGFRSQSINSLKDSAANDDCMTVDDWLSSSLSKPFRHLWIGKTSKGYASVVMPSNFQSVSALTRVVENIPGATLVDKPGSISKLFGRFRQLAAWATIGATTLVYCVLLARYGSKFGGIVLLPTILSLGVTSAVLGYLAIPITLFHVLALVLVLGVGVNYAIFLVEGESQRDSTALGVLLSVITTLLSFGLLAFSSVPAAKNFGVTLAIGILASVLLSPISLILRDNNS